MYLTEQMALSSHPDTHMRTDTPIEITERHNRSKFTLYHEFCTSAISTISLQLSWPKDATLGERRAHTHTP